MGNDAVLKMIKETNAKFIDLRFTDTLGKEQHITIPVSQIDQDFLNNGKMIDGSSIKGWQSIHESDLALMPDTSSVHLDPFYQDTTLIIRCNVFDPATSSGYEKDPRTIAMRAEAYLKSTGIADSALFGPEPEFFMFDDVRWKNDINECGYKVDSEEAHWNSYQHYDGGNIGHRPGPKGGYFPVPPVDSSQDIRSTISLTAEALGMVVEAHHHEVATGNQCEVATRFAPLVQKADEVMMLKYVIHNVAHNYGKTATFMPKPLVGDNGNGMHCHMSLSKDGENIFSGDGYAGLSEEALHFIGGVIKHARVLNAFTNPSTNSYKRLVPGFEAPVMLAYSSRNRSAAIRIPYVSHPKAVRIEVRFPDPTANPYLAFSAILMAGLDGIQNRIDPGAAREQDLYELTEAELKDIPTVCHSLDQAIELLEIYPEFLMKGGVFTKSVIDSYIALKKAEIQRIRSVVHPVEFEMYYSL